MSAGHALDEALHSAVPGTRAHVLEDPIGVQVRLNAWDARELADALETVGVPDCRGIDNCVWASLHTNVGWAEYAEEHAMTTPLVPLLRARARQQLRRWARIGAKA